MQPTVGLAALVSLAATLGGAAPAPSASCPAALTVWSFEGGFGIDESWTVRILDVRADRGRVDELTIRSAAPRWPAAEVRWFAASTPEAEPYALTTGTRTLIGRHLDQVCRDLARTDAAAALVHATAKTGDVVETRGSLRLGLRATPAKASDRAAAAPVTDPRRDLTRKAPATGDGSEDDPERRLAEDGARETLTAATEVLDALARSLRVREGEHAAIPLARRILDTIRALDAEALPKNLPSEFRLTAAVADRDFIVATAVETLSRPDDPDRRFALRQLGEQAVPAAADDLVLIVRQRADEPARQDEIAFALRALLEADASRARLEAMSLLGGPPRVARAALGVFAITEPGVRRELSAVDLGSAAAVSAMAERVRRHIGTTSRDPDLRRAAMGP